MATPAATVAVRTPSWPWLADLLGGRAVGPAIPAAAGAPALAARALGPRRELAERRARGTALGVDLAHVAIADLMAQGALVEQAALHVVAAADRGFAADVTAGIARACEGHGAALAVVTGAATTGPASIALTVAGRVLQMPHTPVPGDAILAFRGHGPTDADLAPLAAEAERRGIGPDDRLANGDHLGDVLTGARPSPHAVLQQPLRDGWPARLAVVDAPLLAALRSAVPEGLACELDLADYAPPAPFDAWVPPTQRQRGAAEFTLGVVMVAFVPAATARQWLDLTRAWNEPAVVIGRVGDAR